MLNNFSFVYRDKYSKSRKVLNLIVGEKSKIIRIQNRYVCLDMYIGTPLIIFSLDLYHFEWFDCIVKQNNNKKKGKTLVRILYRFVLLLVRWEYSIYYYMRSSKIVSLWYIICFKLYSLDLYTYILFTS